MRIASLVLEFPRGQKCRTLLALLSAPSRADTASGLSLQTPLLTGCKGALASPGSAATGKSVNTLLEFLRVGPRSLYGFGETDGAGFSLLKMSGSFVSLKSPGTVNSPSLIGSWLTDVTVLVISVPCPDGLAPGLSAGISLLRIIRVRIGSPGKSRKSGILVLAASQNSDLMDWSCARMAAPSG